MNKKTLVYAFALLLVAGTVGAIGVSAHGWGFGPDHEPLFTADEVEAKLEEKVADGDITQEQADQWQEHFSKMETRRQEMQAQHDEDVANLADFLGLSVDQLQAEIEFGKRINEIAEEQGISQSALNDYQQAQMTAHLQTKLQQLVEAGKLTQEQADAKLQAAESGDFAGPMHGGFGGPRGGWHGAEHFGF